MSETMLRQATNRVDCVGLLKSKNLKYSADGNSVYGTVVIQTEEGSDHSISIRSFKTRKDGSVAKSFTNLTTFMADPGVRSIAELLNDGKSKVDAELECTRVRVGGGALNVNDYVDRSGQMVSREQISANFITQLDPTKPYEPKATFDVECFIDDILNETKNGEQTGRLILKTYIPTYNGQVIPFTFVVGEELASDFASTYEPKSSGNLWGRVVNTVNITTTHKQGIGVAREERSSDFVHEYVVEGAYNPYQDETEDKAFPLEAIQKAVLVRVNETLPNVEKRQRDRQSNGTQAPVASFSVSPAPATPAPVVKAQPATRPAPVVTAEADAPDNDEFDI